MQTVSHWAAALAGAACGLGVLAAEPAFRLPVAFPAELAHAKLAENAYEPATNWTPIAFLFDLPAGLAPDPAGLDRALALPVGTRWVSRGVEAGALVLTTRTQRILAPPWPDLEFGAAAETAARPFTVSAWVWMEDATWFTIAEKGDGREWLFGLDRDDRLSFGMGGGSRRWARISEPLTVDERAWRHYAAVVRKAGSEPVVELYRDGELLASQVEAGTNQFPGLRSFGGALSVGAGPGMRMRTKGALGGLDVADGAWDADAVRAAFRRGAGALAPARDAAVSLETAFPGDREVELWSWRPWTDYDALRFTVTLPADGPTNAEALVFIKDWDHHWYQHLAPGCLVPGVSTSITVSLAAESEDWAPVGHHARWHHRALAAPKSAGIRFFCKDSAWTGRVEVARMEGRLRAAGWDAPYIRDVRPARTRVPRYDKFEVSFRIPDRHVNPFDTNVVRVTARFTAPSGAVTETDGFYATDFLREVTPAGERMVPQGGPLWRVRFAPLEEGVYAYELRVRDAGGEAAWGPGRFTAEPAGSPGFIRVSERDPRHFEFMDGSFFFPIGHNIRSAFDTRHDGAFPWRQRHEEGTAAYGRYFEALAAQGGQMVEVWMAPWSLGLEWDAQWRGYQGIGQYNMAHAWELDRVLEEADRRGLYVNLVIHNHGKYSTFSDNEFVWNPFNVDNGGYLKTPNEFFGHPRAREDFRTLMRYIVARWGYSRRIFAWQLWSELDLVGENRNLYRTPECVEWHETMGREVRAMDPNDHLVSTHVCGDFTHQNPAIISLPEMSLCPVDAYHGSADPLHIVALMKGTAQFNNPFAKPVLITEFGGAWNAADRAHLEATLHAGLWASVGIPLGGAPLFWWWMLIEERNLYPVFGALSRFMDGVDRRDPALVMADPTFTLGGGAPEGIVWSCLRSPDQALGWVCRAPGFQEADPAGPAAVTNLDMTLAGLADGAYAVEFWDTVKGEPVGRARVAAAGGVLRTAVPPFARDLAFKIRRAGE